MYKNLLIAFICLVPSLLFAQREQVNIKTGSAAPFRKFQYYQRSHFEVVNGKFNAALASSNGYLFEINSLSVKNLKCKSVLNQTQFKAVLIDNRMNKTYSTQSNLKGKLRIICKSDGNYELLFFGQLFLDKQKIDVEAVLVGSVSHSRNVKTN
ncbi:MAG: hypothetical protein KA981_01780 [Bacteroidia bacterium]|jgi:hypothetical protein|nr:hypothetical protein [Bacteroidia bacterium]